MEGGGICFGSVKIRREDRGRDGHSDLHECDNNTDNADIWSEKKNCSSNMEPKLRADWVVSIEVSVRIWSLNADDFPPNIWRVI